MFMTLLFLLLFAFPSMTDSREWPSLSWSLENSIFNHSSKENVENVLSYQVDDGDIIAFSCPEPGSFLAVYLVSEMSFLTCQLDSTSKPFLVCDSEGDTPPLTKLLVFRQNGRPPLDPDETFRPGLSHYFISTSNGSRSGVWNSQRGLCFTQNMRLRIDFFEKPEVTNTESTTTDSYTKLGGGLEYSIEEKVDSTSGLRPVERLEQRPHDLTDFIKQVKPEYLEFVRRHAIRGGTGEIRFPNAHDPNTVKKPRFVTGHRKNKKFEVHGTEEQITSTNIMPIQTSSNFTINEEISSSNDAEAEPCRKFDGLYRTPSPNDSSATLSNTRQNTIAFACHQFIVLLILYLSR